MSINSVVQFLRHEKLPCLSSWAFVWPFVWLPLRPTRVTVSAEARVWKGLWTDVGDSSHRGPTLQDQPNASLRDVSETATATMKMEVRLVCLRMFVYDFIRGKSTTNKPRSRKVLEVRKRAGSLDVLAGNCHQLFTLHFMHPPPSPPLRGRA